MAFVEGVEGHADVELRAGAACELADKLEPSTLPAAPRLTSDFPEIDALRNLLPPLILTWSEWRATALGVGADRVLIADGTIAEESCLRAYAAANGIAFEPLEHTPRRACPLTDDELIDVAAIGMLPLVVTGELVYVVAPRGISARRLAQFVAKYPAFRRCLRVTSECRLRHYITRRAGDALGERASAALHKKTPMFSAASARARNKLQLILTVAAAAAALILAPAQILPALYLVLSLMFLAWLGLRLIGPFMPRRWSPALRIPDASLPVYTVIAAVYREAASVGDLVRAIENLDWPIEKLDVKLVVEPDDIETRVAIARLALGPCFEVIVAPRAGPRTKPKALNTALAFARGSFVVVYDAEDRPERDQLRAALATFLAGDSKLACVQAALTIDNTADSWLARMFTAEYAANFDVFLPSLAALGLPLPLGGSSNHFRTAALRAIGAWDPHNVTEDADIGIRLARFGYAATAIGSTTYEEAPAHFGPWLRQRTRWFKGWMQTWLVHMRTPLTLRRDLGTAGFAVFNLVVGGNVLAALIYPLLLAAVGWRLGHGQPVLDTSFGGLNTAALIGGFAVTAIVKSIGLGRRGLIGNAWIVVLAPLHWLLLSLAVWRALFQLLRDPYRWEKTEHGLARSSRLRSQRKDSRVGRRDSFRGTS